MIIMALDPAEYRLGWALGEAGHKPTVAVYKLRSKEERTEDAIERFAVWLLGKLKANGVGLLTVEHFLPSGALRGFTSADTREGQIGLGYAARAVAAVCEVPFRSPPPQTIRKHFCGRAYAPDGNTKAMVVRNAQVLGYIARDDFDDNKADAAALFDFSSSHYAGRAASFALTA